MKPRLTIAIPTYNRIENLKRSLQCVINDAKGKDVEVLISDNASTDGTDVYVRNIEKECSQLKYYRREKNDECDANFLNCFKKAKGEYVLILGDDDMILPGAVDSILDCISQEPVAIYLNTSSLVSYNPLSYTSEKHAYQGYIEYSDKNLFLKHMGIYCTFISALVFKVDLVRQLENVEKYMGTYILTSHILFDTLKNKGKYIVNTFNCVAAQGNETVRYDVYQVWIKVYSELLMIHGKEVGFDNTLLEEQLNNDLNNTIYRFIIAYRISCKQQKRWNKEGIWEYITMFPELVWKYRIIIYCPRICLIFGSKLRKMYRCLFKR